MLNLITSQAIVNFSPAISGTDTTSLTNDATVYSATITVDGTPHSISITGSSAQTFDNLLVALNIAVAGLGSFVLSSTALTFTNANAIPQLGTTTLVDDSLPANPLFSTLTNYSSIVNIQGSLDYTLMFTVGDVVWQQDQYGVKEATVTTVAIDIDSTTDVLSHEIMYTHTGVKTIVTEDTLYATIDLALAAYKTYLLSLDA